MTHYATTFGMRKSEMDQAPFEISIAPMMDWTDRHCRYFLRQISPHVRLYTEMVTTGAILFGDRDRHLRFNAQEHPITLQLGGSDPAALAQSAKAGEDYGYDEINLNCGCPSDRVQNGAFGACLMKDPARVADCVAAMVNAVKIPVTVKCRIGVDDCDDVPFLMKFVETVKAAGCNTFIIHARKAWLNGLSPKENREVPPLRYDVAALVKQTYPDLKIHLNGGITTLDQITSFLPLPWGEGRGEGVASGIVPPHPTLSPRERVTFDGVMIGREAYSNPYFLAEMESTLYGHTAPDRHSIVLSMIPYAEQQFRDHSTPVKTVARHMLGLFAGQRGGKAWRRYLSTEAFKPDATPSQLFPAALELVAEGHNLTPDIAQVA